MSADDPREDQVTILLSMLERTKALVSEAYYQGRVEKRPENAAKIDRLRSRRLMSPDVRDMFSLHTSLRHFLNTVLSTERLIRPGTDFAYMFEALVEAAELYDVAKGENRQADWERYEFEIRDAICAIADAMDSELLDLRTRVASRFAAVSTIAEKRRQNLFYQRRTRQIVDLLESFHFSDLADRLSISDELAESFRSLWQERVPGFRESLLDILSTLRRYLFEYREIEEQARRVRGVALYLTRHPTWAPAEWDAVPETPHWLQLATGLAITAAPDVNEQRTESELIELAKKIPATALPRTRTAREPSRLEEEAPAEVVAIAESDFKIALRRFAQAPAGSSARDFWARNPEVCDQIPEDIWLLCALYYLDAHPSPPAYRIMPEASDDPWHNRLVHDVQLAPDGPG